MFSFYQMGSFNYGGSDLDELFNKDDLKLEDILDQDGIASDLKNYNEKFGNFLEKKPDSIKKMINYMINDKIDKEIEDKDKNINKYPYICSEIFSDGYDCLINAFFTSKESNSQPDSAEKEKKKY